MNGKRSSGKSTRRQLLAVLGTTTAAALAGCGGDGDEDSPDDEDDASDTDPGGSNGGVDDTPTEPAATTSNGESADVPWENDDGDSGGGEGCPSVPMSYTSREWPDEDPYVSFDIPQVDRVGTEVSIASRLRIKFDEGAKVIRVHDTEEYGYLDSSVDEVVEDEDNPELTEEYDVGPDVHVFAWPEAEELPYNRTLVVLPSGSGTVRVKVTIGVGSSDEGVVCQEAVAAAHRRLIETMRTI